MIPTSAPHWREWTLPTPELDLARCVAGEGPPLLFLHGGPGDDHRYLRPMAEPLARRYRCVLYDQRGSGRSRMGRLDEGTLRMDGFLADIEALRVRLGEERLVLIGHSWGAMLAVLYGVNCSERVERMALVGLGPLHPEMGAVAKANLLRSLSVGEREEWADLTSRRRAAVEAEDPQGFLSIHARRMALAMRGWFYSPQVAERFLEKYLSTGDPFRTAVLNSRVTRCWREVSVWDQLERLTAPVLILYGYQDFEPVTQAYLLRERLPRARITLLNECGHLPWLEQPEAFYQELETFLGDT